ncbi:MAG: glycosyltransferase [Algisphaera sp.]
MNILPRTLDHLQPVPSSPKSSKRLRVLLIAEAANPEFVSVPLEGWSHSRAIAGLVDCHVVTQIRNRDAFVRAGLVQGEDFTAIDSERVAARIYKAASLLRGGKGKGWTTVMAFSAISYTYFERLLWKKFGAAIRAGEFDLVHRLTPLSPTLPSRLAQKCHRAGVPFVMGPLNGGVPWPRKFDAARRAEREWFSYFRSVHKLIPGYRATRRYASAIMLGSESTWDQMPERYRDRCYYVPENAIDPKRFSAERDRRPRRGQTLRLIFVGRLVPYKGADMLLEACAKLIREGRVALTIVGEGPERPRLRKIVEREQIGHGVAMPGWVKHEDLQGLLAEHDIFAFPSIREFGGAVVLEAMAVGLVPVVVNYGGPGELVTDQTGFRIPMGPRPSIVAAMTTILNQLVEDPSGLVPLGNAARRRVFKHFTWDAKAQQVVAIYNYTLRRTVHRPNFGMPLPDPRHDELLDVSRMDLPLNGQISPAGEKAMDVVVEPTFDVKGTA